MNNKDQGLFPIRELSARTQVNTVTIRAWERRYGLLSPQRSPKGHRLYCEQDIATIDTILAYIARGVAISKIKPLLAVTITNSDSTPQDTTILEASQPMHETDIAQENHWQEAISKTHNIICRLDSNSLANQWHKLFTHYPIDLCREQILEPLFHQLQSSNDDGAAFVFAQSELNSYASVRMKARIKRNKHIPSIILCAGKKTPIWPLVPMAIRLFDSGAKVALITTPCALETLAGFAQYDANQQVVFYQDGVFNEAQTVYVKDVLQQYPNVTLFGTAPSLMYAALQKEAITFLPTQVFTTAKSCDEYFSQWLA